MLKTNPLLTVKEIASQTGFDDPRYFHSVFKEAFGMTPTAFRNDTKMIEGSGSK